MAYVVVNVFQTSGERLRKKRVRVRERERGRGKTQNQGIQFILKRDSENDGRGC